MEQEDRVVEVYSLSSSDEDPPTIKDIDFKFGKTSLTFEVLRNEKIKPITSLNNGVLVGSKSISIINEIKSKRRFHKVYMFLKIKSMKKKGEDIRPEFMKARNPTIFTDEVCILFNAEIDGVEKLDEMYCIIHSGIFSNIFDPSIYNSFFLIQLGDIDEVQLIRDIPSPNQQEFNDFLTSLKSDEDQLIKRREDYIKRERLVQLMSQRRSFNNKLADVEKNKAKIVDKVKERQLLEINHSSNKIMEANSIALRLAKETKRLLKYEIRFRNTLRDAKKSNQQKNRFLGCRKSQLASSTPKYLPSQECRICRTYRKDLVFQPCGHCSMCWICARNMLNANGFACDICQKKVSGTIKIDYDN